MAEKTTPASRNLWFLIVGILLIVCGIYVLLNPITALIASAIILGILFVFMGVSYLFAFRTVKSYMLLALGILDVLIGILFLSNIGITALTMPIMFALWFLFVGVMQLIAGLEIRGTDKTAWGWLAGTGILGIIFALLIFFYPLLGTLTITFLIGAYLIIYGAGEIHRYIRAV